MSRRPCAFSQTDVKRALKAGHAAGVEIARVEISKNGNVVVVPDKPAEASQNAERNEWDAVKVEPADRRRPGRRTNSFLNSAYS